MPFITDRDLLALQPSLFREVSYLSQTLLRATLAVASGQLTISGGAAFPASVHVGHVALVGDRAMEITAITSSTSLAVSLTRAEPDGSVIAPPAIADTPGSIATFGPQIGIIHHQLLRMLGLEASERAIDPFAPGEASVLNPRDLAMVEAVGTLHLIYTAAAAVTASESPLSARAAHYKERFSQERWRARAIIDTDGDGRADAVRTVNVLRMTR